MTSENYDDIYRQALESTSLQSASPESEAEPEAQPEGEHAPASDAPALPESWREMASVAMQVEPAAASGPSTPQSFTEFASSFGDNVAAGTLRLVDAAQDFAGLIKSYVNAGVELEKSLSAVRELTTSSQQALDDARKAAEEASKAAQDAKQSEQSALELIERLTREHMALAELMDTLRQRIAALSVLGAPMPQHEGPGEPSEGMHSEHAA